MLRSIATENGLGDEHVEQAAQASSVITSHGGYVFKMVGDAVYAAFAVPADAVSAALATQRALAAVEWKQCMR